MPCIPLKIVEKAISIYQHIVFHSRMAVWITCLLVLLSNTIAGLGRGSPGRGGDHPHIGCLSPFTNQLTTGMVVLQSTVEPI